MPEQRKDIVEVYRDDAGEWRWRRKAPNGETIADGAEGYLDRQYALDEAQRVNGESVQYETIMPSRGGAA